MSAELAPRPQQARTAAARPTSLRPVLRALPQRVRQQQMGRLGFAILIVVMLAAGLAGLLVLNTTIQAQSMQIAQETRNLNVLQHQQAVLAAEVDHLRGPQNLQEQAKKLGMRPNPYGSYIDLRTGKVIGTQTKVDGKKVPGVIGETAKPEVGQP